MATEKEKEELMQILKFTPRTYKIQMWGYGGEKVMGLVDPKTWDYCMKHSVDLVDIAWSDEDTVQEDMGLDVDKLPFYPGQWYECDNMAHTHGVSLSAGTIQIEDENGNVIFEKSLDACDGGDDSPGLSCQDEAWVGQAKKGEVVFIGSSNEKGTFFEGEINLKAPFDIEKLVLYYDEVDGEELVNCVYYEDEEIENFGGSTDGKSSDMDMVRIKDDEGNWERYEPKQPGDDYLEEAADAINETFAEELATTDKDPLEIMYGYTEWFPADIKPVRKGTYECEFESTTWPWPIVRMCEWTGRTWKDNGEKAVGIKCWRGLASEPYESK